MPAQQSSKMETILQTLREELNEKKYELNSRFPSEYLLAERFDVNKTTANKAVARLITEGYLKRGRGGQGTIVVRQYAFPKKHIVFLGNIEHPFYAAEAQALQDAALRDHSLVSMAMPPIDQLNSFLNDLQSMKIDAIVTSAYWLLPEIDIPILYLEDKIGNIKTTNYVATNSYHAAYQMMQEVLKRGHRDIVLVHRTNNNPDRLHGYYDAMRQAGIMDYEQRTFSALEATIGEAKLILKRILRQYPNFTAIVACSDNNIYRMIVGMQHEKIEWIGKKALVGFGNVAGVSDVYPIATVDQHPVQIGAEAYRQILRKIANPDITIKELLDSELVNLQNIPIIN